MMFTTGGKVLSLLPPDYVWLVFRGKGPKSLDVLCLPTHILCMLGYLEIVTQLVYILI
jgi:hypothetical protein